MRCLRWKAVVIAVLAGLVVTAVAAGSSRQFKKQTPRNRARGTVEDRHFLPVVYGDQWWVEGPLAPDRPAAGPPQATSLSPGLNICATGQIYDLQQNDDGQRRIATLGDGGLVHFVWTHWDVIPDSGIITRVANYNAYCSPSGLLFGDCGITMSGAGANPHEAMGSFPNVDVGSDDLFHVAFQQRNAASQASVPRGPFGSWVQDQRVHGVNVFQETELAGSRDTEAMWPHLAIDRGGATKAPDDDVFHVASHPSGREGGSSNEIHYWRRVGEYPATWEGPVVLDIDAGTLNHHVATDPVGEKVSVIYEVENNPQDLLQVVYLESASNGADWIAAGVPGYPTPLASLGFAVITITAYDDANGPQAWVECTGEYDLDGRLHIVWVEQRTANVSSECRLMHWDDLLSTAHIIRQAYDFKNTGNDGARDLWLASPQIAFGDGYTLCTDGPINPGSSGSTSNRNYIYVSHEQYGGQTDAEAGDVALAGAGRNQNLEIYLSVSNNKGVTWSPPENLTNTKTPDCDGTAGNDCASERDPSMALLVNDTIHLTYILDTDAGDAELGQGSWTFNPVKYYRIPGGTDADVICPAIAPHFAALLSDSEPDCEYHASFDPPGSQIEQLTIQNLGNAPLTGDVSLSPVSASWLQTSSGAYSLDPGDPADMRAVTMNAADGSVTGEGLYQAQIEITHNDVTQVSPKIIPVDFFVFDEFYCPEFLTLHTDSLWLEVSNTGRYANLNDAAGGLSRLSGDSSWSILDGSLLIGVPPNPDTIVYRNVFGSGNGQPGFRAVGHLIVDTSSYGTNKGPARAYAEMTTVDSTIGIDVEYVFPQHPDSSEFVLVNYHLRNRTGSALTGLALGNAIDFDVTVPPGIADLQPPRQNTGHVEIDYNLIYQQGADTIGHVIVGDATATRFKAGITSIQCDQAPRAWIAPNDPWLTTREGGGFHEGYLYQEMTKTGFELFPPNDPNPEEDLHSVMVFAQGVELGPGEEEGFTVGLVSSTAGNNDPADLINTTKAAWRYAFGWQDVVTVDTVHEGTPMSYPYRVLGVHEDGVGSGCCGCVVEKVSGSSLFTIVPGADPCEGTIAFAGGTSCCQPYFGTFRVRNLCGTYEDVVTVMIRTYEICDCFCPHQCDFDDDNFLTAVDLGRLIDVLFAGEPDVEDPGCFRSRSDFDCDGFATALDLAGLIDLLFAGGDWPCNPCWEQCL